MIGKERGGESHRKKFRPPSAVKIKREKDYFKVLTQRKPILKSLSFG